MNRLVLTDDLLTGSAAIDAQHNQLFAWGNRLLFDLGESPEPDEFRRVMRFLFTYIEYHFMAEEDLMERTSHEGHLRHRESHAAFRAEIQAISRELVIKGQSRFLLARVHLLLSDWFPQHIRYWDGRLAAALRARNLEEGLRSAQALRADGVDVEEPEPI